MDIEHSLIRFDGLLAADKNLPFVKNSLPPRKSDWRGKTGRACVSLRAVNIGTLSVNIGAHMNAKF